MFGGGVVEVPLVPPAKIPRALLTSPGDPMPVDDRTVSTHDDRHVSSECPFLAMRCVALALSETWTLNLMEKCGQKPMKTPNGHNKVFHGPVLDHQPHVPNRLPIPRLGTQLTWKVNCGSKELKLKKISGPNMSCSSQGGANKTNLEV